MEFEEYQLWNTLTEEAYASAKRYIAENLLEYARDWASGNPDKQPCLRTAAELLEYRFATNDEGIEYSFENGILYAICAGDNLFWRVPVDVHAESLQTPEARLSDKLTTFLANRQEVKPIQIPHSDDRFFIVFETDL